MIRNVDRANLEGYQKFDLIAAIAIWSSRNLQHQPMTLTEYLERTGLRDGLSDRALSLAGCVEEKMSAIELMQILLGGV